MNNQTPTLAEADKNYQLVRMIEKLEDSINDIKKEGVNLVCLYHIEPSIVRLADVSMSFLSGLKTELVKRKMLKLPKISGDNR